MAEKVTISRIYHDTVETKYGPKPKTSIYTLEQPEVKMSSFDKAAGAFKEGDVVEIMIEKNGQFTNFKVAGGKTSSPKTSDYDLEARVTKLEAAVFGTTAKEKEPVIEARGDETNDFNDFN